MESTFVLCPLCGGKTRLKLLPDTVLKNHPLLYPKCRREVIISAECGQVAVVLNKSREEETK